MNEIGGEKIDIILWDEDPKVFIENALSPAKVLEINLNEEEKKAAVKVPEDQLSLAIGKSGQNVRLAAKLTGWNVDIEGTDAAGVESVEQMAKPKPVQDKKDLEAAIIAAVEEQNKAENGEETPVEAPVADAEPVAEPAAEEPANEVAPEETTEEAAPIQEPEAAEAQVPFEDAEAKPAKE
jgi:N utilization substance protein A